MKLKYVVTKPKPVTYEVSTRLPVCADPVSPHSAGTFKSCCLESMCFDEIGLYQGNEDTVIFDLLSLREGQDWVLQEVKLKACGICG